MPFIPHTEQDIKEMLETIGIHKLDVLFDEIPDSLRQVSLDGVPSGMCEMELGRLMRERAQQDGGMLCFIGAGAYEHYIPAAVWDIATRGEFYTAYTPYQAEASQGSLQLIYEFQTMMANLMALEVSNASLYDGASALAEAILMAVRLSSKKHKSSILLPRSVHPHYHETVTAIVSQQNIKLIDVPYQKDTGKVDMAALQKLIHDDVAALVIPQPNFFGVLEEVDQLTDWAHENKLLSIAVINPMAMALLKPPGQWGTDGVDIACGEGQPLGIPLSSGGPYYGILCSKKAHARQMPGRIVGRTVDVDGKSGYVLTMQAREQHIRRAKATSNICTNQGLMVTASAIYISLMGPQGLRRIAELSHARAREVKEELTAIPGVEAVFSSPFFHEIVLKMNQPADKILRELARYGIQAGHAIKTYYPELGDCLLVCATETKTSDDIKLLAQHLRDVLEGSKLACLA
ncbi:MAG: aminomethyl-transferring glycine dehydrogenase subunit GcvPA [Gammaproteobacteria bacterium]|nr:aminomethyl-transferring glycine dehydrogenase subunit GcvPA [Gammaproteobacteria bacterium]MCW5582359.1 aminomethyl-transferring glycine dehydrogenase subunit GcvPA [Gammaproteobacteria bacterium]